MSPRIPATISDSRIFDEKSLMRFWEENSKGITINHSKFLDFLKMLGFRKYYIDRENDPYSIACIRLENNIISLSNKDRRTGL